MEVSQSTGQMREPARNSRTDRRTTVGALRHGSLAARHSYVVISEFNLTVHCSSARQFARMPDRVA